jgi:ribosome-associated translation inhibitor RaiA
MTTPNTAPTVAVRGEVPEDTVAYALEKLDSAVDELSTSVLRSEVHLDHHADPARRPRWYVEMVADLGGDVVRARQSAVTATEAIDGAAARLRRRVNRDHDRARSQHLRHRAESSWHHDDEPTDRPPFFPRPEGERTVVRRRTFASRPESIEEAVADLDALDHDFLLFVEDTTNAEAIVYRVGDGFGIRQRVPTSLDRLGAPIAAGLGPATMTVDEATRLLDESGLPFEFFVDAATGDAMVAYHRYDGHHGLVTAE